MNTNGFIPPQYTLVLTMSKIQTGFMRDIYQSLHPQLTLKTLSIIDVLAKLFGLIQYVCYAH